MSNLSKLIRDLPKIAGPFDAHKLEAADCDVLFASYLAGTVIAPHKHDTENIGIITNGGLMLTVAGKETTFAAGEWCHVPARAEHSARFEEESSEIEFCFTECRFLAGIELS